MSQLTLAAALAVVCLLLPNRMLILLSVLGVMLADTPLVPKHVIYFSRFVPSGVLALRTLQVVLHRGRITAYLMVKAWLPFFALSLLSLIYSVDRTLSTQRLLSAVFILIGFGIGIPLFFSRTRDYQRLVLALGLLLGGAVLYSLYLTSQAGTGGQSLVAGRAHGVFRNPNTMGLMAMQAAFVVFYWWRKERRAVRRRLLFVVLLSVVTAVLITGSRASALGLAVGGFTYVRLEAHLKGTILRYLFRLAALGLVVLIVTETIFPELLDTLFRTETSSRTYLWKRAWIIAQPDLFFGVGFGASDEVFLRDILYLKTIGIYVSGAHSSLMRLLVDLGFAGVALAAWAFFRILRQAWLYLRHFEDPLLGAVCYATVAASLVNSLFESWLFGFGSAPTVPFWLLLALLSYQTDVARRGLQIRPRFHKTRLAQPRVIVDRGASIP